MVIGLDIKVRYFGIDHDIIKLVNVVAKFLMK